MVAMMSVPGGRAFAERVFDMEAFLRNPHKGQADAAVAEARRILAVAGETPTDEQWHEFAAMPHSGVSVFAPVPTRGQRHISGVEARALASALAAFVGEE